MKLGRLLLIGRFKKRKRRRKEIGEFSFWERNLGLEGKYICEKRIFLGGRAGIGVWRGRIVVKRSTKELEKRAIATKAAQV